MLVMEVFFVDWMNEKFCIISDKEQMLQTLKLNNVPAIELVDPKTCVYPIIGRKYGKHGGKDITIVNTKDEAVYDYYDFFTKIYTLEEEYRIEVQALSIKNIQKAVVQKAVFHEVPIRNEAFGWEWSDIDDNTIPSDWLDLAIRALYVTGSVEGFVKIGLLPNEKVIVTDINVKETNYIDLKKSIDFPFTIGTDIEFMMSCDDEFIPASTFFSLEGEIGCDERQIEKDSGAYALVEIRPKKSDSYEELFLKIKELIKTASEKVPYENVKFLAGSMPFAGYQCGGHLHFGVPASLSLLRALDHYVAIPISLVEEQRTAKLRRRTNHGGIGRFRKKPYGIEYLSLSSWMITPEYTKSVLALASLVVRHHHELPSEFLFHPFVQHAFYKGNTLFLKKLWPYIKMKLIATSAYPEYETDLKRLFDMIDNGKPFSEEADIRKNWGISVPNDRFERGEVIQIPKRMRLKYRLKEGEEAFVCVGKNIVKAKIHPYPFTFRHPNTIQLSKSLRDKLNIPHDWQPRLRTSNDAIILGPIIGILAARPFDRQTTYFQHLCRLAADKHMFAYVFEPQDIMWETKQIKGTSLNGDGIFPFPAVIYDRFFLGGDTAVNMDEIRVKLQILNHIPFLNTPALFQLTGDKWETYQLLLDNYESYLPESRLLEQLDDLHHMLNEYGEIYVKPIDGAMSLGVIRIIRRPKAIYLFDLNKKETKEFQSVEQLFDDLLPFIKQDPHLIQEGIRRKQYNGKNLEIRVYMQKNEKGIWLRTGMVARLTHEDVMTEHSELNLRVSKVLNHLYSDVNERRYVTSQLTKLAKNIVETVEDEVGAFGELAVDLCIDQYDSVKLLEINSKPDSLFSQIRAYKLRTLAGIRLLNYAASLAGYEEENENRGESS